jgi:hypothetical protein
MRLSVRTQTGAAHVVEATDDDTVASVKVKLQELTGVHPAQQRLVQSGGRKLTLDQDTHTLAEYHLQMDEELVLIERPRPQVVELNVGGARYAALRSTLLSCAGSKLFAMFEGLAQGGEAIECPAEGIPGEVRAPLPRGADGAYFVDRDGASFRYILQYLRTREPSAEGAVESEPEDGDEVAAWLAQPLAPELFEGQEAIGAEIARLAAEVTRLAAVNDFARMAPVVAAGEALKQRVGAPPQAALLCAAVLRDRKLAPALEAAGREEEAASVAERAATMKAECVALGGQVPPEEGDEAQAAGDELELAAKPYLPATATELQLLAAEAVHFGLGELSAQCRRRLRQLESERARAIMLHSTLTASRTQRRLGVSATVQAHVDADLAFFRPAELAAARLRMLQLDPGLAGLGHTILGKFAEAGCGMLAEMQDTDRAQLGFTARELVVVEAMGAGGRAARRHHAGGGRASGEHGWRWLRKGWRWLVHGARQRRPHAREPALRRVHVGGGIGCHGGRCARGAACGAARPLSR